MDSSKTIEFVLTGKVGELTAEEWAALVWRVIEERRSSFQNLLGFHPLKDFFLHKTGGGFRQVASDVIGFPYSPVCETQCRQLIVLESSVTEKKAKRGSSGRQGSCVEHKETFLAITRYASLLLNQCSYDAKNGAPSIPAIYEEELTQCSVFSVDSKGFVKIFGEYREGPYLLGRRILKAFVSIAEESHRRRLEMAQKDLETARKLDAIIERIV